MGTKESRSRAGGVGENGDGVKKGFSVGRYNIGTVELALITND